MSAPAKSKPSPSADNKGSGAPTSGWAVSVKTPSIDGNGPVSEETFYAAIADQAEAERAVAKSAGASKDTTVKAEKRITADEFKNMGWHAGQVEQWVGPSLASP